MAARKRRSSTGRKKGSRRRSSISNRQIYDLVKRLKTSSVTKKRRKSRKGAKKTSKGKVRKGASSRSTPVSKRRKVKARRSSSL